MTIAEPLDQKLARLSVQRGDCLIWTGRTNYRGYGRLTVRGRYLAAHRISYELARGPIPDGLTIDHLCGEKLCINPDHLEPVTALENHRRWRITKAPEGFCFRGHELVESNVYRTPSKPHLKACRTCARLNAAKYARRRAAECSEAA